MFDRLDTLIKFYQLKLSRKRFGSGCRQLVPKKMKKVWIINHYGQTPGGPGGTRHFHLAEYLKDFGWEATIISASFGHRNGSDRLAADEDFRLDSDSGVRFLWVRTPSYRGNGFGRIRNMVSFARRVMKTSTTVGLERPDVVIGSTVHPLAAFAGALLARRHKVPFVFEVRDLWPQTLIDMGKIRSSSMMAWSLRKLELWLYKRASRIVVLLPEAWRYIVPLGIDRKKIVWIPNGVDTSLFADPGEPPESKVFSLMYFGAHGEANGIETIIYAMGELRKREGAPSVRLRLIGRGERKPALIDMANRLGLENVVFEDVIPKNQIPGVAAGADAFVISVRDLPNLYKYGISMNKIFEYLAAARPIVIASSAVNNPINDANAGITVPAGDVNALASSIAKLAEMPREARLKMGRSGRIFVQDNYSYSKLAARLAQMLDEIS